MTTVTAYTAERMKAIEDNSIVAGEMVDGHLILQKFDETLVDAGPIEAATTRDTLENLVADNDIHPVGRIIVPINANPRAFKLSDGVTAFNSLPWFRSIPDPVRNEYNGALLSNVTPASNNVLANLTSLGSLVFTVASLSMMVRMRLMNWFGSVGTDYFGFFICLSDGTIKGTTISSPNQTGRYQGCIEVEWLVSTPGTYTVKGMYSRALGTGAITIPACISTDPHYLQVAAHLGG